ncbi:hypothetical protein, partial [Nonomuraea sp. NPDC050691]|uniref:hypothetical protein n=1 Tax=Nonomuraea sp. NPDC050691 TaxID=3155661 RepID=UPI0033F1A9BC
VGVQAAVTAILAFGSTFVIVTGGTGTYSTGARTPATDARTPGARAAAAGRVTGARADTPGRANMADGRADAGARPGAPADEQDSPGRAPEKDVTP